MLEGVGAAKIIALTSPEGGPKGYALELRRLLDNTISIRILQPGGRAGIGHPGNTVVPALAGAFAKCSELAITTRVGAYKLKRELTWVRVEYASLDGSCRYEWTASLAQVLDALRSFGRAAA